MKDGDEWWSVYDDGDIGEWMKMWMMIIVMNDGDDEWMVDIWWLVMMAMTGMMWMMIMIDHHDHEWLVVAVLMKYGQELLTSQGPGLLRNVSVKIHVNKDFQACHLIGWRHSWQPIRSHVRKFLLTNMEFDMDFT